MNELELKEEIYNNFEHTTCEYFNRWNDVLHKAINDEHMKVVLEVEKLKAEVRDKTIYDKKCTPREALLISNEYLLKIVSCSNIIIINNFLGEKNK